MGRGPGRPGKTAEFRKLFMEGYSIADIAKKCEVSRQTVHDYLKREKLITPKEYVYDHEGNKFKTEKEMCEKHGVNINTYYDRKKRNLSIRECLKTKK